MSVAAAAIAILTALVDENVGVAVSIIDADDTPPPRALAVWLARALLTQLRNDDLTESQIRGLLESKGIRYALDELDEETHDA